MKGALAAVAVLAVLDTCAGPEVIPVETVEDCFNLAYAACYEVTEKGAVLLRVQ